MIFNLIVYFFNYRHDGSVFTPIYQRVVASLLEHSHNMSVEDLEENFSEYDGK